MRDAEISIFRELLAAIAAAHVSLPPQKPLTGFLAMVGAKFNHELMVVGRAVNGWTEGWSPSDLLDPVRVEAVTEQTLGSITRTGGCPMLWVTESWGARDKYKYNTKGSAFWRVIRKTVDGLGLADVESENWPSFLVWSNLYKVAPFKGGNPSSALCKVQKAYCLQLLRAEVDEYKPKRLLLLTGVNWASPFLQGWTEATFDTQKYKYVEGTATYEVGKKGELGKIVTASHPQGKDETGWVQDVVNAFSECLETRAPQEHPADTNKTSCR